MLNSIEVEIDAKGQIHALEPLPKGRRGILTLLDEPVSTLKITNNAEPQPFADICGILTAKHSVSLEEMDAAVLQHAKERFNDCD